MPSYPGDARRQAEELLRGESEGDDADGAAVYELGSAEPDGNGDEPSA